MLPCSTGGFLASSRGNPQAPTFFFKSGRGFSGSGGRPHGPDGPVRGPLRRPGVGPAAPACRPGPSGTPASPW